MLPVVCKNCRLTPQLHESAGGLPSLKLSLHSCSLPGSTNAMGIETSIALVLPAREHECNGSFNLGRPPALSRATGGDAQIDPKAPQVALVGQEDVHAIHAPHQAPHMPQATITTHWTIAQRGDDERAYQVNGVMMAVSSAYVYGVDILRNEKMVEWLTRGHVSIYEMD
ncbi:hypothetical protein Tco_0798528 [Tanacetum coccineum]